MYVSSFLRVILLPHFCRIDKRFYRAAPINRWLVVSFADRRTFPEGAAQDMVRGFLQGCRSVGKCLARIFVYESALKILGMAVNDDAPFIKYLNGQGRIGEVSDFSLLPRSKSN